MRIRRRKKRSMANARAYSPCFGSKCSIILRLNLKTCNYEVWKSFKGVILNI